MTYDELKRHTIDVVKGALGAALVGAALGVLQFLGAHIPGAIEWLTSTGGGVAVIKATRWHV